MGRDCIGCGYCCRKAPCSVATYAAHFNGISLTSDNHAAIEVWSKHGCPFLKWNGSKWLCGMYLETDEETKKVIAEDLAFGEGCCSGMNTYQMCQHVPTPEELKDEPGLLKRLTNSNL